MRKFFIGFFGIIVVAVLLIIAAWNIAPTFISSKLSKATKVPVSISAFTLSPRTVGSATPARRCNCK